MFTAREWERAFSKEREWTAPAQPAEPAAFQLQEGIYALHTHPQPAQSSTPRAYEVITGSDRAAIDAARKQGGAT